MREDGRVQDRAGDANGEEAHGNQRDTEEGIDRRVTFAARAGLACVVLAHEEAPAAHTDAMRAAGAAVVLVAPSERDQVLRALVLDGWFPATTFWPLPVGSPLGTRRFIGPNTPAEVATLSTATNVLRNTCTCSPALNPDPLTPSDRM